VRDKRKVGEGVKGEIFLRKKAVKINHAAPNHGAYVESVVEMLCEIR